MFAFESLPHGSSKYGELATKYILSSSSGVRVEISSFGATILGVWLKDINVAPCFTEISELENRSLNPYLGALIGRVAGRTSGAKVCEPVYATLSSNDGENSIHGGNSGFDQKVWLLDKTRSGTGSTFARVTLQYVSNSNEEGYPGKLQNRVTYSLMSSGEGKASLGIEIKSQLAPDQPISTITPSCLTNHTYWTLTGSGGGHPSQLVEGEAHDLDVTMNASRLLPQRESDWMPPSYRTVPAVSAKGVGGADERGEEGMLDFSKSGKTLRERIATLGANNEIYPGSGINAYFRVDSWTLKPDRLHPLEDDTLELVAESAHPRSLFERLLPAARFYESKSGRTMSVKTTLPGFVLYTNFGYPPIPPGSCICIETQYSTDSANEIIDKGCEDEIPRCLLRAACHCNKCEKSSIIQPEVMHDLTIHDFTF